VAQLSWLGVDPAIVERLRPLVDLLPVSTPVNINTAPREVLSAVLGGMDSSSAERVIQARQREFFKSTDQARTYIGSSYQIDPNRIDVNSRFFEVSGRLRLEGRVLEERSIVERRGLQVLTLMRERYSVLVTAN
jgi:general secretion pathway protein K